MMWPSLRWPQCRPQDVPLHPLWRMDLTVSHTDGRTWGSGHLGRLGESRFETQNSVGPLNHSSGLDPSFGSTLPTPWSPWPGEREMSSGHCPSGFLQLEAQMPGLGPGITALSTWLPRLFLLSSFFLNFWHSPASCRCDCQPGGVSLVGLGSWAAEEAEDDRALLWWPWEHEVPGSRVACPVLRDSQGRVSPQPEEQNWLSSGIQPWKELPGSIPRQELSSNATFLWFHPDDSRIAHHPESTSFWSSRVHVFLCLEIGSLIQSDWYPYKKRKLRKGGGGERMDHMKTQEKTAVYKPRRKACNRSFPHGP